MLPRGPRFPTFPGVRPPTAKDQPPLRVGSRVVVTCRGAGSGRLALTDDTGTTTVATVADGVEVEILAWRPRRGGETRYRVATTNGEVEGWLGAASLRPPQPPPAPNAVATPPVAPRPSPTRTPPLKSQRKTIKPSPKTRRRGTR